jgi:TP901 family phage tail tape measure protein
VDALGSVIARVGDESAATESEIVDLATRIAQATARFEVSSAEAVGFAGSLRSMGVRAEAGGTQVSQAFENIGSALAAGVLMALI